MRRFDPAGAFPFSLQVTYNPCPRKEGMEAVAATAAPAGAQDARARAGDREAFNELYGPHFEEVYDYVLRILGEREPAAGVVRETFARAWRAFPEQGNDVAAWLYTTARSCALDALRYRRDRNGAEREALVFTLVDGDRVPDATVLFDRGLVELVWDAAAALPREDYSLLALHVRHGLSADELGEHAPRVARLRNAFDQQVTSRLVVARARHTCSELELLVALDDDGQIGQHIRHCDRCRVTTSAFVLPSLVLGSLEQIAPSRSLAREIFRRPPRRRLFGVL
jgi:DNA-directed RNA polymerase specialized sigma24 family protein